MQLILLALKTSNVCLCGTTLLLGASTCFDIDNTLLPILTSHVGTQSIDSSVGINPCRSPSLPWHAAVVIGMTPISHGLFFSPGTILLSSTLLLSILLSIVIPGIISIECWMKRPAHDETVQFDRNCKHLQCC